MNIDNHLLKDLVMPINLQLEITNRCNMHCDFCYNNSGVKQSTELTKTEWLNLSQSIIEHGGVFHCIISGGEPTLLKNDIIDIMDKYDSDGSVFTLISNGTGIDDVFAKLLSKYKWYWVQISLDSYIADKHDHIRGSTGAWNQAILAINFLKSNDIPVSSASVITNENFNDMEGLIKLAISLGIDQVIFSSVLYSGRASNKNIYYDAEDKFILYYNELEYKYKNKITLKRAATYSEQIKEIITHYPETLIIRPNGDVKIDCILPFNIGNIRKNNISDIWMKAKMLHNEDFFQSYLESALKDKFSVVANNINQDIFY